MQASFMSSCLRHCGGGGGEEALNASLTTGLCKKEIKGERYVWALCLRVIRFYQEKS